VAQFWRVDSPGLEKLGIALLFSLATVWQIPHVIALRYFLIVALCALYLSGGVAVIFGQCRNPALEVWRKRMLLVYVALIVWMLVVAIVISDETLRSLRDIRGDWLPATLCLAVGLGAGLVLSGARVEGGNYAVRAVFWGLVFHAVLQLGAAAWLIAQDGRLPAHFPGISDHRANVTYTNALGLAMLIAEAISAAFQRARFLGLSRTAFLVIYGVLLLSTFASASRNGVIVFILLTIIGGGILIFLNQKRHHRTHFGLMVVGGLLVLFLGVWFGIKSDLRWQRIVATIPVAWDIDSTDYWLNPYVPGGPKAADGGELDISVFHRVALARVAWRYFMEHPLGTDASRETLKRLVTKKYPNAMIAHGHNSYLDFGLATGFPGLLLWVAFLSALACYGVKRYQETGSPYAMALILVLVGYFLRGGLDSIFREHMLQEFMLCVGLLIGAIDVGFKE
jgi:O-antigen ligase